MKTLFLATTLALLAVPAMAQDHSGHAMGGADSAATSAYKAANMAMHEDMTVEYSGDADIDFVRNMIPHHQGAVDMARIVLEYGADPEVKAFAEKVIAAQEDEITWMKEWLAKHDR